MYQFPLQKVLDYRKTKEEEEQRALGVAVREKEVAEAELTVLQEDLSRMQDEVLQCQVRQVDIQRTLVASDYTTFLSSRVKEREQTLSRLEERLHEQLRMTEKAMQDRKVMDTLRDKGERFFQHELNQAEQRENDELARFVYQWHRQN